MCACCNMSLRNTLFQKQLFLTQMLVLTEMASLIVTVAFRSQLPLSLGMLIN